MNGPAIRFEHVTKAYDLQSGTRTLFSSIRIMTGSGAPDHMFRALTDISFEVGKGEAFGIIGRNGAGKSTILKIIAGITKPTSGMVSVNGLVSSLLELGAGFHPDMTGRENVYISGAILGISKKFIDRKFSKIVDFAELWDFIDVPVKKYSSGMYARLGFSVAVAVEPEILIVDEILSVGDIFFQQKCFAKMREIIKGGTTFVFVTHDTAAMQNLCDRALLLEEGRVSYLGETISAVNRYIASVGRKTDTTRIRTGSDSSRTADIVCSESTASEIVAHSVIGRDASRHGSRGLEIVALRLTDPSGSDTMHVGMMQELIFHILLRANGNIPEPTAGLNLFDRMGNLIFAAGTPQLRYHLPSLKQGEEIVVQCRIQFSVGPGEYTFSVIASEPSVNDNPNVGFFHDQYDRLGPIIVVADEKSLYPFYGIARLPMSITHALVAGK